MSTPPDSAGSRASPAARQPGAPRAIVVMGVAGSGKTTVGGALADALGWRFVDADDFHPSANVEKMRAGVPLDDADRAPWLARLNALLRHAVARDAPLVLACSALRARYRDRLRVRAERVAFVHLAGDFDTIAARLGARRDHYMPPALLKSQFDALEPPGTDALMIDVREPVDAIVAQVRRALGV